MPLDSEYELMQRLSAGNEDAFGELFGRYYPRVCAFVSCIVKEERTAEDIAQDIFLKIWERRDIFQGRVASFNGYVYRMARNAALNAIRRMTNIDWEQYIQIEETLPDESFEKEYYSREEMAKFRPKRRRVRRIRESENSRENGKIEELKELEEEEGESHRKRGQIERSEEERMRERREGFEKARAKEEIKNLPLQSAKSAGSRTSTSVDPSTNSLPQEVNSVGSPSGPSVSLEGLHDDASLWESLARARRVVLGQRHNTSEALAERLAKEREEEKMEGDDLDEVNEFCKRFKQITTEREKETKHEDLSQFTLVKQTPTEEKKTEEKEEEKTEEKKEEEEEEELFEQPVIGKGLGDALKYLRSQRVEDVEEEAYGRRTDEVIKTMDTDGTASVIVKM